MFRFRIQDVCLILALAALLLTFFSTYVFQVCFFKNIIIVTNVTNCHFFQAGLLELLYDRFRLTIIICMFYFLLTITLQVWTLTLRWKEPLQHNWDVGLHISFLFQRLSKYTIKISTLI